MVMVVSRFSDIAFTRPVQVGRPEAAEASVVLLTSTSETIDHFSLGSAAFLSATRAKSSPVSGDGPAGTLRKYCGTESARSAGV